MVGASVIFAEIQIVSPEVGTNGDELISEIVRVDRDINRYERVMDYSSWSAELFTLIFMMSALLYPLISIISLYIIIVKINVIKDKLSL